MKSFPNRRRKFSVTKRLGRLSKYRIHFTVIESIAESSRQGGNADVVRARCKLNNETNATEVAVKMLRCTGTTDEETFSKEFVHEVEMLAGLSHQNIVQLIGFVGDLTHQKAWIVLSWEPNGNVREFLASGKWDIPERISLIQDMFRGLQYLHTRQPPICHGDLKSLNILVNSSYHAIITDFGSARVLGADDKRVPTEDNMRHADRVRPDEVESCPDVTVVASANQLTLTGPAWSLRWAAPEIVKGEEWPSLASDIWSAGWVCWEMMTDKAPFEDLKRGCAIVLKVIRGEVPSVHEGAEVAALCSLMTDCWKYRPGERPHVNQCCKDVRWMPSVPPSGETVSGPKELSPFLLLERGLMHYAKDRFKEAVSLLEKVANDVELAEHPRVVARALRYLGHIRSIQCLYNEAEESYAKAQEIYSRIANDHGQAKSLDGLGDVRCSQRRYAEAAELYGRAQEIYCRIGDDQGRAHTLSGMGDVHCAQSKYAEAEDSYRMAQEIYTRIGDEYGRANSGLGLGHVHRAECRYTEAEESYTRAQDIYARIGDDRGRANTLIGLGSVHRARCKYTVAEESYMRAQEIYTRIGDDLGRANTLRRIDHLPEERWRKGDGAMVCQGPRPRFSSRPDRPNG